MKYAEIKRLQWETKVFILTAPNKLERFLFYNDPFNRNHTPMIRRQRFIANYWRNMEGLEGETRALQIGGIYTTKEKGNLKYLELVDKGYIKTATTLDEI